MPITAATRLALGAFEWAFHLSSALTVNLDAWRRLFQKTRDWRPVLPVPDAVHPLAVHMVDGTRAFAVGRRGLILRTTDAGLTWERLAEGVTSEDLLCVHFTDQSTGYAVGTNGSTLRTDDGGGHWSAQMSPLGPSLRCTGVFVIDGQRALVVGGTDDQRWTGEYSNSYKPGHVVLTSDGGRTWSTPLSTPSIVPFLHDVVMASATTGVAVGGCWDGIAGQYALTTIIMRTTDGGLSWVQQPFPPDMPFPPPFGCVAQHGDSAWIALPVDEGVPIYSEDGQTWHRGDVDRLYTGFEAVAFLDPTAAIVVGSMFRGAIMKSTDRGASFRLVDLGTFPSPRGVSFGSAATGLAVGEFSTVVRTVDGGETWLEQGLPEAVPDSLYDHPLEGVSFAGRDLGVVVGRKGFIARTTNGGR